MAVPAELLLSALSECECGGPQGHDGRPPLTDSFPADDVPVTREPPLISEPPLAAEPDRKSVV